MKTSESIQTREKTKAKQNQSERLAICVLAFSLHVKWLSSLDVMRRIENDGFSQVMLWQIMCKENGDIFVLLCISMRLGMISPLKVSTVICFHCYAIKCDCWQWNGECEYGGKPSHQNAKRVMIVPTRCDARMSDVIANVSKNSCWFFPRRVDAFSCSQSVGDAFCRNYKNWKRDVPIMFLSDTFVHVLARHIYIHVT